MGNLKHELTTDQAGREASGAHRYGRYLEEFEVGAVYKHWPAKTVTEADDHLFCLLTMNHHPLHINDLYASQSQQGRNVVVGPLVYALALGMSVSDVSGKAIANLATEELSHPAPVFRHAVRRVRGARGQALELEARPRRGQGPHPRLQAGRNAGRRVQARRPGAAQPGGGQGGRLLRGGAGGVGDAAPPPIAMWEELVRGRGGLPLRSVDDAAEVDLGTGRLIAVLGHDDGILPAVAALSPAQAVAFLILLGPRADGGVATAANRLLESLEASGPAAYLLKWGRVGGDDPALSIEVREEHATAIVDAIVADAIEWEEDPDFGYRVAAQMPGVEGRDRLLLIPRFLYARTERVYEYAAMVPSLKRDRVQRLSALGGLDRRIVDAVR
jgi:acyl dehydratase